MKLAHLLLFKRKNMNGSPKQKDICELIKNQFPGLSFTRNYLSAIETGKNRPNLLNLAVLCEVYGITGQELLTALREELAIYNRSVLNNGEVPEG